MAETQVDPSGQTTSYSYDMDNRRVNRTLPLGQVETYAYDVAGDLTTENTFNGQTIIYTYDPRTSLLTGKNGPGLSVTYRIARDAGMVLTQQGGTTGHHRQTYITPTTSINTYIILTIYKIVSVS